MKQKFLKVALASLFAIPAVAMANVEVGGEINYSLNRASFGAASDTTLNDNESRLSIKASEDLGQGLKIGGVYELNVNADTTNGTPSTRNAFVFVKHGNTQVSLGQQNGEHGSVDPIYNQTKNAIASVDGHRGAYSFVGTPRTVDGLGLSTDFNAGGVKVDVAARYAMLSDSTFTSGANNDTREIAFSADATVGALRVGAAYADQDSDFANFVARKDQFQVAATYDLGVAKLGGVVGRADIAQGANKADYTFGGLSVAVPVTKSTTLVGNVSRDEIKNFSEVTAFEIGAEHKFSKRSAVYAKYADLETKAAGTKTDGDVVSVGVNFKF